MMTCINSDVVLKNWLWEHLYERLKALNPADVVPEDMVADETYSNVRWVDRFSLLKNHPEYPYEDSATCDSFAMYTESSDGMGSYTMQCAPSNAYYTSTDDLARTGQALVSAFTKTRSFYTAGHGSRNY